MTILEVYEKYNIMPQLQEHQLRVAAVGKIICDNLTESIDADKLVPDSDPGSARYSLDIVTACLLHDIGNIIKFDLSKTKAMLNADLDLEYWQKVKDKFVEKYGSDEHVASVAIARELGVSERVLELVDCVGFHQAEDNLKSGDLGKQICAYADMRVMPKGITSLQERFADLRIRYAHRQNEWGGQDKRDIFEKNLVEIEKQIFEKCSILPGDITDERVKKYVLELKGFSL
jgi:hypothetical protein